MFYSGNDVITETLVSGLQIHQFPPHVPAYVLKMPKQKIINLERGKAHDASLTDNVRICYALKIALTKIYFFGQSLDSGNVGLAAIFLGAATVVVVLTRLLKRLKEIAEL